MPSVVAGPDPIVRFVARLRKPVRFRRPLLPSAIRGCAFGFLIVAALRGGRIAFSDNWHEVQPGRVFRSSQLTPAQLGNVIARHHLRTVVNLRGYGGDLPWYVCECHTTHELGISQEDVCLSAIRLPTPSEIRRLLEVLDRAEHPILMHCRQGVDRTGLACVMVKLLEPGVTASEARRHLGLGYGYVPFNGTENMERFFDLYEEWLRSIECVHSPDLFRHWAAERYCPGACSGTIEATADFPADRRLTANRVHRLRVIARNTSVQEWRFRTGTMQGIYARYSVLHNGGKVVFSERAGLFNASVPPGGAIELTLGIPALAPGHYAVQVELCEGEANAFMQFGVEPWVWEFRVD